MNLFVFSEIHEILGRILFLVEDSKHILPNVRHFFLFCVSSSVVVFSFPSAVKFKMNQADFSKSFTLGKADHSWRRLDDFRRDWAG